MSVVRNVDTSLLFLYDNLWGGALAKTTSYEDSLSGKGAIVAETAILSTCGGYGAIWARNVTIYAFVYFGSHVGVARNVFVRGYLWNTEPLLDNGAGTLMAGWKSEEKLVSVDIVA